MSLILGNLIKKVRISIVLILVSLCASEIILRLLGYEPRQLSAYEGTRPVTTKRDLALGWRLIPGNYNLAPHHPEGDSVQMTINEKGYRITKPTNVTEAEDDVLFVGGSFTQGVGVSDNQTYPWKLQEIFDGYNIRNLGVGAYGGYQSLIVMEEELKKPKKPNVVIYGFINHHEKRNVADDVWIDLLYPYSWPNWREIAFPYVTMDDNDHLERHTYVSNPQLPFIDYLAFMYLAKKSLHRIMAFKRMRNQQEVSVLLIKEMQRVCSESGAEFYLAILFHREKEEFIYSLEKQDIQYIDCHVELTDSNKVKGDLHPNESVHEIYAKRIGDRLIEDRVLND